MPSYANNTCVCKYQKTWIHHALYGMVTITVIKSVQVRLSGSEKMWEAALTLNWMGIKCTHNREDGQIHTSHTYSGESATCQSKLRRKSLIGSMAFDAQLELQKGEYPRARGKQESIRTPQTLRPAINLPYYISWIVTKYRSLKPNETTRMIRAWDCLNMYNRVSESTSKSNT